MPNDEGLAHFVNGATRRPSAGSGIAKPRFISSVGTSKGKAAPRRGYGARTGLDPQQSASSESTAGSDALVLADLLELSQRPEDAWIPSTWSTESRALNESRAKLRLLVGAFRRRIGEKRRRKKLEPRACASEVAVGVQVVLDLLAPVASSQGIEFVYVDSQTPATYIVHDSPDEAVAMYAYSVWFCLATVSALSTAADGAKRMALSWDVDVHPDALDHIDPATQGRKHHVFPTTVRITLETSHSLGPDFVETLVQETACPAVQKDPHQIAIEWEVSMAAASGPHHVLETLHSSYFMSLLAHDQSLASLAQLTEKLAFAHTAPHPQNPGLERTHDQFMRVFRESWSLYLVDRSPLPDRRPPPQILHQFISFLGIPPNMPLARGTEAHTQHVPPPEPWLSSPTPSIVLVTDAYSLQRVVATLPESPAQCAFCVFVVFPMHQVREFAAVAASISPELRASRFAFVKSASNLARLLRSFLELCFAEPHIIPESPVFPFARRLFSQLGYPEPSNDTLGDMLAAVQHKFNKSHSPNHSPSNSQHHFTHNAHSQPSHASSSRTAVPTGAPQTSVPDAGPYISNSILSPSSPYQIPFEPPPLSFSVNTSQRQQSDHPLSPVLLPQPTTASGSEPPRTASFVADDHALRLARKAASDLDENVVLIRTETRTRPFIYVRGAREQSSSSSSFTPHPAPLISLRTDPHQDRDNDYIYASQLHQSPRDTEDPTTSPLSPAVTTSHAHAPGTQAPFSHSPSSSALALGLKTSAQPMQQPLAALRHDENAAAAHHSAMSSPVDPATAARLAVVRDSAVATAASIRKPRGPSSLDVSQQQPALHPIVVPQEPSLPTPSASARDDYGGYWQYHPPSTAPPASATAASVPPSASLAAAGTTPPSSQPAMQAPAPPPTQPYQAQPQHQPQRVFQLQQGAVASPPTSPPAVTSPSHGFQAYPIENGQPPTPNPPGSVGAGTPRTFSASSVTPNQSSHSTRRPSMSSQSNTPTSDYVPPVNVLIVEDNNINRLILVRFMKLNKIKFDVAKNGDEAVHMWKNGNYHIVLMDIRLPVKDGIQATHEIRQLEQENLAKPDRSQATPVIIVAFTASSLQRDRVAALAAGCNDFLTKPVSLPWLRQKILEWGSMAYLSGLSGKRPSEAPAPAFNSALLDNSRAVKVAGNLHLNPKQQKSID